MLAYKERLAEFLDDFINNETLKKYERESIRAIVVAGEASPSGVKDIGEIAQQTIGTDVVAVLTEIDPVDVIAHGAAVFARRTKMVPEKFIIQAGNYIVDHDEL